MGDNRNFIIAILLSVVVFVGWQHFVVTPRMEAEKARQQAISEQQGKTAGAAGTAQTTTESAPGAARLPEVGTSGGATITPTVLGAS